MSPLNKLLMLPVCCAMIAMWMQFNSKSEVSVQQHAQSMEKAIKPMISEVESVTTLMKIAFSGSTPTMKQYLNQGGSTQLDAVYQGETALHYALLGRQGSVDKSIHKIGDHEEIIELLLKRGSDMTLGDLCPLSYAVSFRNSKAIELLLSHPNKQHVQHCILQRDGSGTLLHQAVTSTARGFARFFMRLSSEPNLTKAAYLMNLFKISMPPMRIEGELDFVDMNDSIDDWDVRQLVASGADVNAADIGGRSPVMEAIRHQRYRSARYLVEHGADINHRDPSSGESVLHLASLHNACDFISTFKLKFQDVNVQDRYGRTPAMLAMHHNHHRILDILKEMGSSIPEIPIRRHEEISPKILETGGWNSGNFAENSQDRCDIDRIDASKMNFQEFMRDYVSVNRPVVLFNLISSWKAWKNWKKENLLKFHGDLTFEVGSIPYPSIYGVSSKFIKLRDFVENMENSEKFPSYIFEGKIEAKISNLSDHYSIPEIFAKFPVNLVQFMIGPKNSGSPPHFHGDAWNALIFGKKHWFLYPPDRAFFSRKHVMKWYEEDKKKRDDPLECLQRPGEIVYVPSNWGHAVINMQSSVALAIEFDSAVDLDAST
eukprot:TRINITY_DN3305_c3_g1_i3.p1 TRINITY_DN3305_c3_g1~~TRINITY_DN3305_c3_g1_i3.p1  ORF type:complete len:601 (+),score=183.08 TRINITY_DN3305_c3_g1_i3:16-1818(+)